MRTEPAPVRRRPCTATVTTARTKENKQEIGQSLCQLSVRSLKQRSGLLVEVTEAMLGAPKGACGRVRKPVAHMYREIRGGCGERSHHQGRGRLVAMQVCD